MATKPLKPIKNLALKTRISVWATALNYGSLLVLFLVWNFVRNSGPSWIIFAAQTLPLLLLLPGLWQRYYRSYSWLCFLILVYFIKAVDGAFMSNASWIDYLFLLLTVNTFISAMMAARWLQRLLKD